MEAGRKGHRLLPQLDELSLETVGRASRAVAGVYADVNRMPRQVVRGPWKELYHLVGLASCGTHQPPARGGGRRAGRSYPCCNYCGAAGSFRALAKLHAVFVAHLYLHPGSPSSWAERHPGRSRLGRPRSRDGCWRFEGPQHPRKETTRG